MLRLVRPASFSFTLLTCLFSLCLVAQPQLSTEEWRADLRFLQETIHNDYSFLFKKTTKEAFDTEVEKLDAAIPTLASHEIVTGLARLVASFEYGHTSLRIGGETAGFHRLPINLYHFSDGLYVEGIHQDYAEALGAKVIAIEGTPIDEALAAIYPVIPAENEQYAKGYGLGYIDYPEILHAQGITDKLKRDITFTLEKDGKTFATTLTAGKGIEIPDAYGFTKTEGEWRSVRPADKTPEYLDELGKIYYFKYLPEEKAVYVRYSQVMPDPAESIQDFYQRVFDFVEANEVDRLILDVRLNGGGNNFNNKTVVTGIIRSKKINQKGKFYVIIGRRTFSAAQNLINELHNYTNAIFVGEPSSENINFYGDNRPVTLPNSKLTARLSWAWWQDKPQWQGGKWMAPQVAVDLSFADYLNNEDPVLSKALSFDAENFIPDPMDYLTELFQTGQIGKIQSEAVRMAKDPAYRYYDFEGRMLGLGQRLVDNSQ
ncbi:MAG: hypothetical protein AAF840_04090, partial [Bacteroidota bacterium]